MLFGFMSVTSMQIVAKTGGVEARPLFRAGIPAGPCD